MRRIWQVAGVLLGLAFVGLCARESLLGVSAYTLPKVSRFELESMRLGEYEIPVPYTVEDAFIAFSGARASGIIGCNRFSIPYQVQGGGKVLVLGGLTQGKRACAGEIEARLEEIFMKNFQGRFIVQGDDERVELVGEGGFRVLLVPSLTLEP